MSLIPKEVGEVNVQAANGRRPSDSKIHVIDEPNVEVLVEVPARRHSVVAGTEGDTHDTSPHRAKGVRLIPQPCRVHHAVAVVPPVLHPADEVVVVEVSVETEDL